MKMMKRLKKFSQKLKIYQNIAQMIWMVRIFYSYWNEWIDVFISLTMSLTELVYSSSLKIENETMSG